MAAGKSLLKRLLFENNIEGFARLLKTAGEILLD